MPDDETPPLDPEALFREFTALGIRWPKPTDHPFASEAGLRSVRLENFSGVGAVEAMGMGYFEAARIILLASEKGGHNALHLGFPAIFLYRQFIELALKHVISVYGPAVGVQPNWTSHDLGLLWRTYQDISSKLGAKADVGDQGAEAIIKVFAAADPGSYSFRYPVDRAGKPNLRPFTSFSPRVLLDVMEGLNTYLWGAEEYFDHLASLLPRPIEKGD